MDPLQPTETLLNSHAMHVIFLELYIFIDFPNIALTSILQSNHLKVFWFNKPQNK